LFEVCYWAIPAIYLFFVGIPFGFVLSLDHIGSLKPLGVFLDLKGCLSFWGPDWFPLSEIFFLLFVIVSQNLFNALCHQKENKQSLLLYIG